MTTMAEKALERLAKYEGQEEWNDCIDGEGYDQDATVAADPANRNEVAIYKDGSKLEYLEQEHRWVTVNENVEYVVILAVPRETALQRNGGTVRWQDRQVFQGTLDDCRQFGKEKISLCASIGGAWIENENGSFVETIREGPDEAEENISATLGL